MSIDPRGVALVLAGGIALGAFEAGAYEGLHEVGLSASLRWLSGSSIGSVTACIIAGTPRDRRVERLRQFWNGLASDPAPALSFWLGALPDGPWRQAANQASAWQTLLLGRPGLFRPRLALGPRAGVADVPALYDLAPLALRLVQFVDFDLLNHGDVRVSLAATDVVSGERVVFDNRQGCVIGPQHVLASCALLPLFAPVEFEGRLFGDGGLSSNAPLDLVVAEAAGRDLRCFVVDLFAAEGSRPHTLAASASRAGDLAFGNQSRRLLEGHEQSDHLRQLIAKLGDLLPPDTRARPEVAMILAEGRAEPTDITYIGYRAGLDEAGLGKVFDFSTATINDRWDAGKSRVQDVIAAAKYPGVQQA